MSVDSLPISEVPIIFTFEKWNPEVEEKLIHINKLLENIPMLKLSTEGQQVSLSTSSNHFPKMTFGNVSNKIDCTALLTAITYTFRMISAKFSPSDMKEPTGMALFAKNLMLDLIKILTLLTRIPGGVFPTEITTPLGKEIVRQNL